MNMIGMKEDETKTIEIEKEKAKKQEFVVLSVTCSDCGSKMALKAFGYMPTIKDIISIEYELGGMFCIESYVFKRYGDDYEYILSRKDMSQ